MKFEEYYVSNQDGKSNCVIRTFCKLFGETYDNVYDDLCLIAKELKTDSFNDIPVFEEYMKRHNTFLIDYESDIKLNDLNLEKGKYAVFCWDKKDFYHMVSIIDNILYDKDDKSLELYTITIYKTKVD